MLKGIQQHGCRPALPPLLQPRMDCKRRHGLLMLSSPGSMQSVGKQGVHYAWIPIHQLCITITAASLGRGWLRRRLETRAASSAPAPAAAAAAAATTIAGQRTEPAGPAGQHFRPGRPAAAPAGIGPTAGQFGPGRIDPGIAPKSCAGAQSETLPAAAGQQPVPEQRSAEHLVKWPAGEAGVDDR